MSLVLHLFLMTSPSLECNSEGQNSGSHRNLYMEGMLKYPPTRENLVKKGLVLDTTCVFCGSSSESVPHVLAS